MAGVNYAKKIDLTKVDTADAFRNLKTAKKIAIDIGGSLVKLAYIATIRRRKSMVLDESNQDEIYRVSESDETGDCLNFVKFESKYIDICLDFIKKNVISSSDVWKDGVIKVTGGGAFQYRDLILSKLGVEVKKEDEMECLIKGCNFLLKNLPDESFLYQKQSSPEFIFQPSDPDIFPYLLVNIGSGVSIIKVDSEDSFDRIGGSSIGGGTFWGLGCLLSKAKNFDQLLALAEKGDHRKVDVLVKDIYGSAANTLDLSEDIIASSFGKAVRCESNQFREEDLLKSLLITISNDIGQIAYLNAKNHGLKKIYFGGFFIRGHPITMHTITYAINYWSQGNMQALFLRHEGYLGAIGAFLMGAEENTKSSWLENYAGSSGLQSPRSGDHFRFRTQSFDVLELHRFETPLAIFPMLKDPANYFPDAVDLTQDEKARMHWLQCFEDSIDTFVQRAVKSEDGKNDAENRAQKFKEKYINRLHELRENPSAYGSLTVRSLLDIREHYMKEFNFTDPFSQQKQLENEQALKTLSNLLAELSEMSWNDRQLALIKGVLAGNVFDWGAKEVVQKMESLNFGFKEAANELQDRPWLFDDFDKWLIRLTGTPHKCAVIFCDNSGADIILGIVPFVEELLRRGTQVILCANSQPALNDVTFNELVILMKRVGSISNIIASNLATKDLIVMESGQASPCLDLRYLSHDLVETIKSRKADLLVLEGMGRSVHTNCYTKFTCETLKIAVLKNRWLCKRFGGVMFSAMFKYEVPDSGD